MYGACFHTADTTCHNCESIWAKWKQLERMDPPDPPDQTVNHFKQLIRTVTKTSVQIDPRPVFRAHADGLLDLWCADKNDETATKLTSTFIPSDS